MKTNTIILGIIAACLVALVAIGVIITGRLKGQAENQERAQLIQNIEKASQAYGIAFRSGATPEEEEAMRQILADALFQANMAGIPKHERDAAQDRGDNLATR